MGGTEMGGTEMDMRLSGIDLRGNPNWQAKTGWSRWVAPTCELASKTGLSRWVAPE
jgi:hypothetical protein